MNGRGLVLVSLLFAVVESVPAQSAMGLQDIAGDYNQNRAVDAADYVVWRNTLGGSTLPNRGAGIIGPVSALDFAFWKSQFGRRSSTVTPFGNGSGVPEPGSCVLALIAILGLPAFLGRRRRSRN